MILYTSIYNIKHATKIYNKSRTSRVSVALIFTVSQIRFRPRDVSAIRASPKKRSSGWIHRWPAREPSQATLESYSLANGLLDELSFVG